MQLTPEQNREPLKWPSSLLPADIKMFLERDILPDDLLVNGVRRVSHAEALEHGRFPHDCRNLSGVLYPYRHPDKSPNECVTVAIRLDEEVRDRNGKVRMKYVMPWGDGRSLYFAHGTVERLKQDPTTEVVLVESIKAALTGNAWARRHGRNMVFLAMGGCWSWMSRSARGEERADGSWQRASGPLDALKFLNNRTVRLALDSNVATNSKVRHAQNHLVAELKTRNVNALVCDVPVFPGVNGPDDFFVIFGDEAFTRMISSAHPPAASGSDQLARPDEKEDTCGLKLKRGTEIVEREQVWEVPDFIPGETLIVVIGEIGFGKTRMCVSLCADISRGRIPVIGGERTSGNVLLISNEDSEARLREMFVSMDGDLEKLYVEDEDTDLPWNLGDIASLEARIAQTQADIVVIDSLSTYRPDGVNLWSHSEVAPYLVQLRKLANRQHCTIVLVHHDNKTVTDDPIRKVAGTKGIPGTARHNILVGIDKDGDPDNDRIAANFKTNLAKNRNKAYRFQLLPSFRWKGEVATTAREVLRAQAELDQTARQVRGEQTRKEKEEREARRRDQAASELMTEIDRRTLTHEPAMLKTDAEAFLMAKGFKRDPEVRPAIASGRFKEIPIKGKGNPVELHRSGSHIESAAEMPPSQNANNYAGPEKSDFGGPHLEHTAQIDSSKTRMNSGDLKPEISAADSNGNRSANINSASAERPGEGPPPNSHDQPDTEVKRLVREMKALFKPTSEELDRKGGDLECAISPAAAPTLDEAVEAWNRRHSPTELPCAIHQPCSGSAQQERQDHADDFPAAAIGSHGAEMEGCRERQEQRNRQ